jgi:hypothetical protein
VAFVRACSKLVEVKQWLELAKTPTFETWCGTACQNIVALRSESLNSCPWSVRVLASLRSVNLMTSHFLKFFRDKIRDQMTQRPENTRIVKVAEDGTKLDMGAFWTGTKRFPRVSFPSLASVAWLLAACLRPQQSLLVFAGFQAQEFDLKNEKVVAFLFYASNILARVFGATQVTDKNEVRAALASWSIN